MPKINVELYNFVHCQYKECTFDFNICVEKQKSGNCLIKRQSFYKNQVINELLEDLKNEK